MGKNHTKFNLYRKFLSDNNIIDETKNIINGILVSADNILEDIDINKDYLYRYTQLILNRKY